MAKNSILGKIARWREDNPHPAILWLDTLNEEEKEVALANYPFEARATEDFFTLSNDEQLLQSGAFAPMQPLTLLHFLEDQNIIRKIHPRVFEDILSRSLEKYAENEHETFSLVFLTLFASNPSKALTNIGVDAYLQHTEEENFKFFPLTPDKTTYGNQDKVNDVFNFLHAVETLHTEADGHDPQRWLMVVRAKQNIISLFRAALVYLAANPDQVSPNHTNAAYFLEKIEEMNLFFGNKTDFSPRNAFEKAVELREPISDLNQLSQQKTSLAPLPEQSP